MINTVVLNDRDMGGAIMGMLVIENHSCKELEGLIQEVKNELPGSWSLEDVIEKLHKKGWSFSWNDNVTSIDI